MTSEMMPRKKPEIWMTKAAEEIAMQPPCREGIEANEANYADIIARHAASVPNVETALRGLMAAYERRIRSNCTTPDEIAKEPWRCAEYVAAEQAAALHTRPPAPAAGEIIEDAARAFVRSLAEQGCTAAAMTITPEKARIATCAALSALGGRNEAIEGLSDFLYAIEPIAARPGPYGTTVSISPVEARLLLSALRRPAGQGGVGCLGI